MARYGWRFTNTEELFHSYYGMRNILLRMKTKDKSVEVLTSNASQAELEKKIKVFEFAVNMRCHKKL